MVALLLGASVAASAQAPHSRRGEVNHRLSNQNRRIDHKEASGQMSLAEAARLHHNDRHIRREERNMAHHDHGHITKAEQNKLNRQENRNSNQITHH
ncbi:MAG: hypothetical protein ABI378_13775 [Chitinophagaceae bacterium]